MKSSFFLVAILLYLSQPKQETVSGTLYFKMIEFVNTYGMDMEQQKVFEKTVSEIKSKKNPTQAEQEFITQIDFIKQAGLDKSPYIKLKTANGKILLVFMSEDEYKQFSGYNLKGLLAENKKVTVKMDVTEMKPLLYKCKNIVEVKKISGKTPWNK